MYSTFRSFRHPFAVYLAAMFYLRRVRVPRCGIDEVKAEHRFLHYWRVEISVFLRDVLQQGVEAKATPRRIAKHHKPVLLSALIHALGKERGQSVKVCRIAAKIRAFFHYLQLYRLFQFRHAYLRHFVATFTRRWNHGANNRGPIHRSALRQVAEISSSKSNRGTLRIYLHVRLSLVKITFREIQRVADVRWIEQ